MNSAFSQNVMLYWTQSLTLIASFPGKSTLAQFPFERELQCDIKMPHTLIFTLCQKL